MDPFMARMLERSKIQLSKLPDDIAETARLREKELLEAYFVGFQNLNAVLSSQKPEGDMMQPVFKIPAVNNLSNTKSYDRPGKGHKSPPKEFRKSNIAVVAPSTTELYPRRPARSVYNSLARDGNCQIFENRYKSKMKNSSSCATAREPMLNIQPTETIGSIDKEENKDSKTYANPYPSLPRINTSYDLDRLANKTMALKGDQGTVREKFFAASSPKKSCPTPPKTESEDVNICKGGVKKMVEKFSQVSTINNSPVRVPPKSEKFNLNLTPTNSPVDFPSKSEKFNQNLTPTNSPGRVSPKFEKLSKVSTPKNSPLQVQPKSEKLNPVSTPKNSPVRAPPMFEKFNRSPLASSTVNSKSPPIKLVVPKLFNVLEPSKPEFREVKSREASPRVDIPSVVPADCQPAYETLQERPLSMSSYNVDNFLKDALGSELFFQSISSINSEAASAEYANTSILSSDSAPVADSSAMIPDNQGFLSLRVDYSASPHVRTDDNKEKFRRSTLETFSPVPTDRKSPSYYDQVKRLTTEANIQRSLVAQSSKALYLCRTAKQFKESQELVEAERILLLASLRNQAAVEEIKRCGLPCPKSASRGSVTVSDIFVPLKWDVYPKLDPSLCPQWFVSVLIMGETVLATEAVQLVDNNPILKFPGSMHLSDLSCDFRARLQLYAFRTPQSSPKRKCKIMRACKMLRRPTRNCLGPAGSTEELMYLRNPAFKLIGCTELTVQLIGQQQPVSCSLEQVPMVSIIKGTINFRLSAQLLNTLEYTGFLNVLRPAGEGHAWQRWWCHLDGKLLRFWNYPSDQEEKEPVFSIDLLDCLSERVTPAPRVLCSRARTLMLESQRSRGPHDLDSTLLACSPNSTIVRHFLACDTAIDMTEWASAINECLEALRLWNIVPDTKYEQPA